MQKCGKDFDGGRISAFGKIYRLALARYHQETLGIAIDSITATPRNERNLIGHTISIHPNKLERINEVLSSAIKKIEQIGSERDGSRAELVYQITLGVYPLTKKI